jgi:hypothetical protein
MFCALYLEFGESQEPSRDFPGWKKKGKNTVQSQWNSGRAHGAGIAISTGSSLMIDLLAHMAFRVACFTCLDEAIQN